jgi:hypothetical protein
MKSGVREIVVYVPAGGHPATQGIARGSAIVGRPRPGAEDVKIYFEGATQGQSGMRTLADRALHAYGRLAEEASTTATRVVPRDALVVVGTFEPGPGRIVLTGEHSAAAVATWLGVPILDSAELRQGQPPALSAAQAARLSADVSIAVNGALAFALITRAGLWLDGAEWVAPDGRRTSAVAEALTWALVAIAGES